VRQLGRESDGVASTTASPGDVRLGGADFVKGTRIAHAVRIAWERDLVIDEVVAVQRGGDETLTSGFVPVRASRPRRPRRRSGRIRAKLHPRTSRRSNGETPRRRCAPGPRWRT
jgi:hypothetical protein